MREKIKNYFREIRRNKAINDLGILETERSFISVFFLGETMYKIRLEQWKEQMKDAKRRLEANSLTQNN